MLSDERLLICIENWPGIWSELLEEEQSGL